MPRRGGYEAAWLLCAVLLVLTVITLCSLTLHGSKGRNLSKAVAPFVNALSSDKAASMLALENSTEPLTAKKIWSDSEIISYLKSGANVQLSDKFVIGQGGVLSSAPTLRTQLIDRLGRQSPHAAAQFAKKFLNQTSAVEERVLHLRNYIWGTASRSDDPFFVEQVTQLLLNKDDIGNPSRAYLEGFDFIVYSKSPALLKILSTTLLSPDAAPATQSAALFTLMRVANEDKETLLDLITTLDSETAISPKLQAAFLSVADPRSSADRDLVTHYWQQHRHAAEEMQQFAQHFPLAIQTAGNYLLTEFQSISLADYAARDRAALQFVNELAQQFPEYSEVLSHSAERIQRYVSSAEKAGI